MKRPAWLIAVIVLWALLGALTTFTAILIAFLFDAPGSEDNRYLHDVAVGLAGLPLTFLFGAAAVGFVRSLRWRLVVLALPLIPLAMVVYGFAMISAVCGGQFSCH